MRRYYIPPWKIAPFIRILPAFVTGIILQYYCAGSFKFIATGILVTAVSFVCFSLLKLSKKYFLRELQGIILILLIAFSGMMVTFKKDIRNDISWFPAHYQDSCFVLLNITQPPEEKEKSDKAVATVESIFINGKQRKVTGKIIIYLQKDSTDIQYGDRILILKKPDSILNNSNPGGFNYSRYAGFQQIYHTVYLTQYDYQKLKQKEISWFHQFIFRSRENILFILRKWLTDDKKITGIAEALLIGYKLDLDKELVQAYSNTGVVHIIAISGLHLGLIYFMLLKILNWLPGIKSSRFLKTIIILGSLWLFAILTGSSASVLRSAVMFTCIVTGSAYFNKSSIYNSLAASAFLLLCFDPFFLWDAGFQLSYVAVIGIIWLQNPLYRSVYIKNKWLLKIWSLLSVTIAAQVAAFPVCIYYFHQFPNVFLLSNLVAVPLSSVILFMEIFLVAFSWIPFLAFYTGKITSLLIGIMNYTIDVFNKIPFAVTDNIYATELTTYFLYAMVVFICCSILYRRKTHIILFIIALTGFCMLHAEHRIQTSQQKKIIVYNIPQKTAIELIAGNTYRFIGDSIPESSQKFYLGPSRTMFQIRSSETEQEPVHSGTLFQFARLKLLVVKKPVVLNLTNTREYADIVVLGNNTKQKIADLIKVIEPGVIIFDSSNSLWKIEEWKKECTSLLLRFHSVPEDGAFVSDIK